MNNKKLAVLVVVGLLGLLLYGAVFGLLTGRIHVPNNKYDQSDPVAVAKSRISLDTDRDEAIDALSDAWFHASCRRREMGTVEDLFFYGSRDPDDVQIVLIRSRVENGATRVFFVGMLENYMLHLYEHCVPIPATAFSESS